MEKIDSVVCVRCGSPVQGSFCSQCGTPVSSKSKATEWSEISSEVTGLEATKLWRTVRDLTLNPGIAINEFANGNRSKYLTPLSYFLLVFSLSFAIDSATGINKFVLDKAINNNEDTWTSGFIKGYEKDGTSKLTKDQLASLSKIDAELRSFINSKGAQMVMILPALLLFQWLLFRKYRKSFLQNGYFALYSTAHYSLLVQPLSLIFFVSKTIFLYVWLTAGVLVPVAYCSFAGLNFYPLQRNPLILRTVGVYVLIIFGTVITSAIISLTALAILVSYYFVS